MEGLVKGDVIVVPFPLSARAGAKRRPVLVIGYASYSGGLDYICCMITTKDGRDADQLDITNSDMIEGSLNQTSYIRPGYLYTCAPSKVHCKAGKVTSDKLAEAIDVLKSILDR